jgi:hypothetical protein
MTHRMSARFSFHVDPVKSLVQITMEGFFSEQDVAAFSIAQDEAYRRLRCEPNQHVTLVDMRGMRIQARDSVTAFQRRMNNPKIAARKIAFVVAKSLARMQIKRATEGLTSQLFSSDSDARAWLLSDPA